MKEFEMSVSIDGQTNLLRTWGESVAHAIDNMVLLSDVQDIYKIKLDNGKEYLYSRYEIERYRRTDGRVC